MSVLSIYWCGCKGETLIQDSLFKFHALNALFRLENLEVKLIIVSFDIFDLPF